MTLLSLALKPFFIITFIVMYKFLIFAIKKILPRKISDFLLKNR